MKKIMLIVAVLALTFGGIGIWSVSNGSQAITRLFSLIQQPEGRLPGDEGNPMPPGSADSSEFQDSLHDFGIKPYDPKADDAILYVRARTLIQITEIARETNDKFIRPVGQQLERQKQDTAVLSGTPSKSRQPQGVSLLPVNHREY